MIQYFKLWGENKMAVRFSNCLKVFELNPRSKRFEIEIGSIDLEKQSSG